MSDADRRGGFSAGAATWHAIRRGGMLVVALGIGALVGWAAAGEQQDGTDRAMARRIVDLTNEARARNAQPALTVNPRLTLAAEAYARDMARRGLFDHIGPDGAGIEARAEVSGYGDWVFLAENLATGTGSGDPAGVVERWLNSTEHRRNVLSPIYVRPASAVTSSPGRRAVSGARRSSAQRRIEAAPARVAGSASRQWGGGERGVYNGPPTTAESRGGSMIPAVV